MMRGAMIFGLLRRVCYHFQVQMRGEFSRGKRGAVACCLMHIIGGIHETAARYHRISRRGVGRRRQDLAVAHRRLRPALGLDLLGGVQCEPHFPVLVACLLFGNDDRVHGVHGGHAFVLFAFLQENPPAVSDDARSSSRAPGRGELGFGGDARSRAWGGPLVSCRLPDRRPFGRGSHGNRHRGAAYELWRVVFRMRHGCGRHAVRPVHGSCLLCVCVHFGGRHVRASGGHDLVRRRAVAGASVPEFVL